MTTSRRLAHHRPLKNTQLYSVRSRQYHDWYLANSKVGHEKKMQISAKSIIFQAEHGHAAYARSNIRLYSYISPRTDCILMSVVARSSVKQIVKYPSVHNAASRDQ